MASPAIGILPSPSSLSAPWRWILLAALLLLWRQGGAYAQESGTSQAYQDWEIDQQGAWLSIITSDTIQADARRKLASPPLFPGRYHLHVRITSENEALRAEADSSVIQLIVEPPWYSYWWAYSLWAILLALNLYTLYWQQSNQRLALEKVRQLEELLENREWLLPLYPLDAFLAEGGAQAEEVAQAIQKEEAFCSQLLAIIEHYIKDPSFTAEQLSQELFLGYNTCLRKVKAFTGMTVTEYIRHIRMQRAARMLKEEPTRKIISIAEAVGYTSNTYFTREFKKVMGCTPTAYKRQ